MKFEEVSFYKPSSFDLTNSNASSLIALHQYSESNSFSAGRLMSFSVLITPHIVPRNSDKSLIGTLSLFSETNKLFMLSGSNCSQSTFIDYSNSVS